MERTHAVHLLAHAAEHKHPGCGTDRLASSSASGSLLPAVPLPVDPSRDAPLRASERGGPRFPLRYDPEMVRVRRGGAPERNRLDGSLGCLRTPSFIAQSSSGSEMGKCPGRPVQAQNRLRDDGVQCKCHKLHRSAYHSGVHVMANLYKPFSVQHTCRHIETSALRTLAPSAQKLQLLAVYGLALIELCLGTAGDGVTRSASGAAMQAQRVVARLLTAPAALRTIVRSANQCNPTFVSLGPARELCRPAVDARGARAVAAASSAAVAPPMPPFHLAFPVNDLSAARDFYGRCDARLISGRSNAAVAAQETQGRICLTV